MQTFKGKQSQIFFLTFDGYQKISVCLAEAFQMNKSEKIKDTKRK